MVNQRTFIMVHN